MQHIFQYGWSRTWVFLPFWKISNHQSSQTKQFTNSQSLHEDPASKTRSKHLQPSFFHHMFFLFQLPILSFMFLLHEIANYNPNTFLKNRIGDDWRTTFKSKVPHRYPHSLYTPSFPTKRSCTAQPRTFFSCTVLWMELASFSESIPTIFFFHFFGGGRKSAVAVIFGGGDLSHTPIQIISGKIWPIQR